jgi:hypothetical protein
MVVLEIGNGKGLNRLDHKRVQRLLRHNPKLGVQSH